MPSFGCIAEGLLGILEEALDVTIAQGRHAYFPVVQSKGMTSHGAVGSASALQKKNRCVARCGRGPRKYY